MSQLATTKHEGYLEHRFYGVFDDVSLLHCIRNLWEAADYDPSKSEIYDFSEVDASGVSSAGIRIITNLNQLLHSNAPRLPLAVVANQDLSYGMSRVAATMAEPRNPNIRVFRDYPEAVKWISF